MGLTHAISARNWIFRIFILVNLFLLFFMDFKLLMFRNKVVKISEILNKRKLLKTSLKFTYPINYCIFCSQFVLWGKMKLFYFLKPMNG